MGVAHDGDREAEFIFASVLLGEVIKTLCSPEVVQDLWESLAPGEDRA